MLKTLNPSRNYLTRIRKVNLLYGEKVLSLFTPGDGMVSEPPSRGRLLVTTNQRIIFFSDLADDHETMLYPIEELKAITLKSSSANPWSLWQGLMTVVGGLVLYFAVSYWLTGKFDGPNLPIINIDLGPLVVLIGILAGGWFAWKHFFVQGSGVLNFQGSSWTFSLPYQEEGAGEEIYQLIDSVFNARNARVHPY